MDIGVTNKASAARDHFGNRPDFGGYTSREDIPPGSIGALLNIPIKESAVSLSVFVDILSGYGGIDRP